MKRDHLGRNIAGVSDPPIERVMSRIQITAEGCWIFTGAKVSGLVPYGVVGRGTRGQGNVLAHRVTYEHFVGPIPGGLDIDHLCRTPPCCNPTHLEPVTRSVNNLRGRLSWKKAS